MVEGEISQTQIVSRTNGRATRPTENPAIGGLVFVNWYNEAMTAPFNFNANITENTIVNARFNANPTYITADGNFVIYTWTEEVEGDNDDIDHARLVRYLRTNLSSITIPQNVTEIAPRVFQGRSEIENLSFATPTKKLDNNGNVTFYSKMSIGANAFEGTNISDLKLPYWVESIGNEAFKNAGIETVVFERVPTVWEIIRNQAGEIVDRNVISYAYSNLTSIGAFAFADNDIEEVNLPFSVARMGARVFENNENLETMVVTNRPYRPAHFDREWNEGNPSQSPFFFTVTFWNNITGASRTPVRVREGEAVARPAVNPAAVGGAAFANWYDAYFRGVYDFDAAVLGNMTIRAGFNHTVTFVNNNSTPNTIVTNVVTNSRVARPVDPTLEGHTFAGWYTSNSFTQAFNFNNPISANISAFARFIPN
jgi:uncharacterized repeat protein (TIGR02543 family)